MVSAQEVAIVTGTAGGLGQAMAGKLACRGIRILIADVQEERGKRNRRMHPTNFGVESIFCKTGVTKEEMSNERMVQTTVERWSQSWGASLNDGPSSTLGLLRARRNRDAILYRIEACYSTRHHKNRGLFWWLDFSRRYIMIIIERVLGRVRIGPS